MMLIPLPEDLLGIVKYDENAKLVLTTDPTPEQKKMFDEFLTTLKHQEEEMIIIE